jgi:hypothetical protein
MRVIEVGVGVIVRAMAKVMAGVILQVHHHDQSHPLTQSQKMQILLVLNK